MSAAFARLVRHVLEATVGALLGYVIGQRLGTPLLGAWCGGVAGLSIQAVRDVLGIARLEAWLRLAKAEHHAPDLPRLSGFWRELGYRFEGALRERERRVEHEGQRLAQFLSAIEALPNGVLLLDANDHILWCSRVAAGHFALDPQRDLGQRVTNLVRAPGFVAHLASLTPSARDTADAEPREPVVMPSPARNLNLSVLAVTYANGLRLVLSQDVTDSQRNDEMRRNFVANVSHEIRTPLTVLVGFVDTLADLPLSEAERARVIGLMRQQSQRMQSLVDDLLTLARIEGSAPPPPDRWIDLAELVGQVRVEAEGLSRGRHQISWNGESTGIELAGNTSELRSAMANLISNAVRYTPEQGQIDFAVRTRHDGRLQVEVRDSGIGIAPEHLPRLTERFYRVDGSRSRATGGTGLGLAIVKHVVQRHGGELQIRSELGRGSTFAMVLPAARVRHEHSAELGAAV
ncbi:MAG: phosphate regulon sensor histidine kinase PhoR [Burkholderiales bacterium]|nr:phosphate regulon sensor histidine kinase PhoR [Burkholderiales bacterium]